MTLFVIAVGVLFLFAVFDLVVGVSNDAVNFLNSSIGSRVASRRVIFSIAGLGILCGVAFSGGMMEVARKGIFNPGEFTMPDLMVVFVAVMLADVLLLDLFNTYGLPTSTTVSIVFELLGAAVVVSLFKIAEAAQDIGSLAGYINTNKVFVIIAGILLSVVVAFVCGALVQYATRLLFTFGYDKRLKRYGGVWGGVALASITYFILVKGVKGSTFVSADTAEWIQTHTLEVLATIFGISTVLLQVMLLRGVNILKPIVLIGTFALAMAFAGNDLVNFIGVPIAGYHAYSTAVAASNPTAVSMAALGAKVSSTNLFLLLAGAIMVLTLWFSRKARGVVATGINLAQQSEREEDFGASFLSRAIVRMGLGFFDLIRLIVPRAVRIPVARRMRRAPEPVIGDDGPSFDLLRAVVNLMVASVLISYATSYRLPLSTTYVTFMVAMGTSFADGAWGRDSAVYRVTGVLTVVGGWFMTAFMAASIAGIFALTIYGLGVYGFFMLLGLAGLVIARNHRRHGEFAGSTDREAVFNLKKVTDIRQTVTTTYEHMSLLIAEIRQSLDTALAALADGDATALRAEKRRSKTIQRWTNIVTANVFKTIRLLEKQAVESTPEYSQTARRLQKIADGTRDIVLRSYQHVANHHKPLAADQMVELAQVNEACSAILADAELILRHAEPAESVEAVVAKDRALKDLAQELNLVQAARIRNGVSKTRLSILYYSILGGMLLISKQSVRLLLAFGERLSGRSDRDFDLD